MAEITFLFAPNRLSVEDTTATVTWHVLATDGVGYTTRALLTAAGKAEFPNLDRGMFVQGMLVRSIAADGIADGSAFYVDYNKNSAPTDSNCTAEISGSGQQLSLPGVYLNNIWFRKTTATDFIKMTLFY